MEIQVQSPSQRFPWKPKRMKTISEHRMKDESSQLPRKVPSFAQVEKVAARLSLTQPPLHNRAFPTMATRAHPRPS